MPPLKSLQKSVHKILSDIETTVLGDSRVGLRGAEGKTCCQTLVSPLSDLCRALLMIIPFDQVGGEVDELGRRNSHEQAALGMKRARLCPA